MEVNSSPLNAIFNGKPPCNDISWSRVTVLQTQSLEQGPVCQERGQRQVCLLKTGTQKNNKDFKFNSRS